MNRNYSAARRALVFIVAGATLALAACDHKQETPTCGTSDTPPCAVGTGGAPHDSGGGVEQQK